MSFKKYIVLCGNHLVNYFSLSMIYWMPQIQEKASISIQNLPMFFIAIVKMSTGRDIRLLRVNWKSRIDIRLDIDFYSDIDHCCCLYTFTNSISYTKTNSSTTELASSTEITRSNEHYSKHLHYVLTSLYSHSSSNIQQYFNIQYSTYQSSTCNSSIYDIVVNTVYYLSSNSKTF